ncbi:MAG: hypothetical protein JO164_05700 [Candidatus Eremiobacteraeota bacterium]|nr:hypothetical protein [Candidatus Eremiobacteraeota bacterium]
MTDDELRAAAKAATNGDVARLIRLATELETIERTGEQTDPHTLYAVEEALAFATEDALGDVRDATDAALSADIRAAAELLQNQP